ncbi:unnamed protein product [Jaminaea pallidilutea]
MPDSAARFEPVASTSMLPPVTPRPRYKRKSAAPLSSKQLGRMARQLQHVRLSSRRQGLLDDEEEAGEDAEAGASEGEVLEPHSLKHRTKLAGNQEEDEAGLSSDSKIKRERTAPASGSEGASRNVPEEVFAKPAAHGIARQNGDSFAQEASFVSNPLGRRIPQHFRKRSISREIGPQEREARSMLPQATAPPSSTRQGQAFSRLNHVSKDMQETLLLEDLLNVLMGIEGQFIYHAPGHKTDDLASQLRGPTYMVDPAFDPSIRELVLRVLPLASCYSAICTFLDLESSLRYGTVIHAMCAGIRDIIEKYEGLVINLEHRLYASPHFTLQKLWLFVHPTLRVLSLVYGFVMDVAAITHADILDQSDSEENADSSDDHEEEDTASENGLRQDMEQERRQMFDVGNASQGHGIALESIDGGIIKGGEVLSMLWDRVERLSGDLRAFDLFLNLFHRASQPYARTLLTWINTGILIDPYDEFMVFEDERVTYDRLKTDPSDTYWEQRYTLRDLNVIAKRERERQGVSDHSLGHKEAEHHLIASGRGLLTGGARIPTFLEAWKAKILLAGKYLNVMRQCGVDIETVSPYSHESIPFVIMTEEPFLRKIEEAYQHANARLLDLLLHQYHLVDRLRSLKHYFFFSSSDFFSSFIEQADRELRRVVNPMHVRDSVKSRLQTHLGMILGSSAVVGFTDPYKEEVKVGTALDTPYESLKRIANTRGVKGGSDAAEAIALKARTRARDRDYTTLLSDILEFDVTNQFPVSLVISRKNMIRWKFLHCVLIQLKITERQLADVWQDQRQRHWQSKARDYPELEAWKMRVFKLRHRMTFFVRNVLAFFTSEIVEPHWVQLERKMESAKTVDQFLRDHTEFLNECRRECMLTDVRFVEFLQRLMMSARTFYENRSRLDDHLLMASANWTAAKLEGEGQPGDLGPDMWRAIEKQESKWSRSLKGFNSTVQLLATTDNPSALPLAMRLQSA